MEEFIEHFFIEALRADSDVLILNCEELTEAIATACHATTPRTVAVLPVGELGDVSKELDQSQLGRKVRRFPARIGSCTLTLWVKLTARIVMAKIKVPATPAEMCPDTLRVNVEGPDGDCDPDASGRVQDNAAEVSGK